MAHRSTYEDHRRHGREHEYRHERDRGPGSSRYGAEGRSWDDAPAGGYRPGGERSRYGPRGRTGYAAAGDYGDRDDAWRESGYRSGGYGEDVGRRPGGASREHAAYRQGHEDQGGYDARRFTGRGYSAFGGDYGQRGHGGFGSGGYDDVSQTGGGGMTGSGHAAYGYQQGGYAPGAQIWEGEGQDVASGYQTRHHDFDPDYLHWRDSQMRDLDRDYQAWRDERRQKFSREFDDWRSQRRAQGAQTQASTLSQAGGGYGTPGASSDGDLGETLQSNPQSAAGADETARKKN